MRDLRFAVRGLLRAPGYALAFVLTLGLGIGAGTAIFTLVNGVLLQPLPYRDDHELVYLRQSAPLAGIDNALFSVPEILDYRARVDGFAGVAEFSALEFTVLGLDEQQQLRAGIVSGNYFEVMGLGAAHGRVIQPTDDGDAAPVMVLTHDYWMRAFGGDPEALGRALQVNGRSTTIVGVAAPAPPYPEETDIYVNLVTSPHHLSATMQTDRAHRMTEVFARLAPGATLDSARSEVRRVAAQGRAAFPEFYDTARGYSVTVTPLQRQLAARATTVFLLLLGAAGFVLLIACANVANLTLARAARRRRELAVRASLGAGRGALRRQLLIENLLPALLGAGLGLVVAHLTLAALVEYAARYTARAAEITIDATVFGAALLVGVLVAGLFALLPRLPAGVPFLDGSRTVTAARSLQRGLVVVQVAVCFVLLIGAGLLLRTLWNLHRADGGLRLDTVLTMHLPQSSARTATENRLFLDAVIARVGALPGVNEVALASRLPLAGAPEGLGALLANFELEIEGVAAEPEQLPRADFRVVTPGYFDTLGMRMVAGRGFNAGDGAEASMVVIINESMARHHFPDRDAVGRRIRWVGDIARPLGIDTGYRTVVGVVSDSNDFGIVNPVPYVVFHPFAQYPAAPLLFVRSERPASVARPAVDAVHAIDPQQPVLDVATLADVRAAAIAPQRLNATLLGTFALLAVTIAAVGVAGVLAFSVSQRTRELGVRAALGAGRGRLLGAVLGEGTLMAAVGLALGGAAALGLSRLAGGLLYEVSPADPGTYFGVGGLLLVVVTVAAWIPARRAARVDPVVALAAE